MEFEFSYWSGLDFSRDMAYGVTEYSIGVNRLPKMVSIEYYVVVKYFICRDVAP